MAIKTLGKRSFQRRGVRVCYVEIYDDVRSMVAYSTSLHGMKRARQNARRLLEKYIKQGGIPIGRRLRRR